MEIVLNNLVSNAVKYNRDGGSVTVALERKDDVVKIQVADTGIGMTPEESAKLFNEFVRIKNEDTIKDPGERIGPLHRAQAGPDVQRRRHGQERKGLGQHLHRHSPRRRA